MYRTILKLGFLLSLLTGCAKEPTGPGTSIPLRYPVLLGNDRQLLVKDNVESLTKASVSLGPNFVEFTILDSNGALYSIPRVREFDRKSAFFDMGTSQFRVFLELKAQGKPSLEKAKTLVKEMAFSRGEVQDTKSASHGIDGAGSFAALIEVTRESWRW